MLPQDFVNLALDALPGVKMTIGSFYDGTDEAEQARRIYGLCLRQMLRTANWSWARKRGPLFLLGDSTGVTQGVSTIVEFPWIYAYEWPNDALRIRWLPWSGFPPQTLATPPGNIPLPGNPAAVNVPNLNIATGLYPYERPARYLESSSDQYPSVVAVPAWDQIPDFPEGAGPTTRRIILTNVQNAQLVYTFLALEPQIWDQLFIEAFIHSMAERFAPRVIENAQLAIAERDKHIAVTQRKIREARIASAQESGWPQSVDIIPDWIRVRRTGYMTNWFLPWGDGIMGGWGGDGWGWDAFSFSDGSVF